MSKKLPLVDHRAVREHLENADFALAEGPEFEPSGSIDRSAWSSIFGLPDDVAIRTTDYRPHHVERATRLANLWLNVVDHLADGPLKTQLLTLFESFHCSLFNAVCGWYRTAGLCLRSALDDFAVGAYYELQPAKFSEFESIIAGNHRSPKFSEIIKFLDKKLQSPLFAPTGPAYGAYDSLSVYTHRISYFELWQSTGPIWELTAFERWYLEFQETCLLICRIVDALKGRAIAEPAYKGLSAGSAQVVKP